MMSIRAMSTLQSRIVHVFVLAKGYLMAESEMVVRRDKYSEQVRRSMLRHRSLLSHYVCRWTDNFSHNTTAE